MVFSLISSLGLLVPFVSGALVCPKPEEGVFGHCAEMCLNDGDCFEGELCCSNGCGHDCMKAVEPTLEPPSNLVCPRVKFGQVGHCGFFCSGDSECAAGELCCSNGCGTDCVKAVERKRKVPWFGFDDAKEFLEDALDGLRPPVDGSEIEAKLEWPVADLKCPKLKEGTVGHCAEMCSIDQECSEGELCCSNGCGRQCTKAVSKKKPEMCPASKQQRCRRMCPDISCGKDECLLRRDNCCDLTCEKKHEELTCEWKSSVCDPKNDQCAEGYRCDPKACVPSVCNCEVIKGRPSFMCTADCNPGCVKEKLAPICNEDRHCGFLGKCTDGRCGLASKVSLDDVQYACASIDGDESCQATGCGKKANKNGKCVPKNASKVSCKTVGDNEALCNLLECRFKKGKCSGKSKLE